MDNSCDPFGVVVVGIHWWSGWLIDSPNPLDRACGANYQSCLRTPGPGGLRPSDLVRQWFEAGFRSGFLRCPSGDTSGPQQAALLQQWGSVAFNQTTRYSSD